MDPWRCIWIFILAVICAVIETSIKAVMSQNQASIKRLFPEENEKSQKLLEAINNDDKLIPPAEAAVIFMISAVSVLSVAEFGKVFCSLSLFMRMGARLAAAVSSALVFVITFIILLVIVKNFPKKIAKKYGDTLCVSMLPVFNAVSVLFTPVYSFIDFAGGVFARIAGVVPEDISEDVTKDDIRQMIDEGRESGNIEESETDMIHSIFEFDDRMVSEILTHRTDITAVEISASLEDVINIVSENGFSRIPVYKESLDDVVGILYVKDLLKLIGEKALQNDFRLSNYMRQALYVPETNSLKELFEKFKTARVQMAIVIDEYGGTLGIVTMEDLIESIMGSIFDEYDDEEEDNDEPHIVAVSENEYIADGLALIKDVEEFIGVSINNPENCETVGGLAVSLIGVIPENGEHPEVTNGNITMRVISVAEHRAEKLYLCVNKDNELDESGETDIKEEHES
jgi:putative hemolysin